MTIESFVASYTVAHGGYPAYYHRFDLVPDSEFTRETIEYREISWSGSQLAPYRVIEHWATFISQIKPRSRKVTSTVIWNKEIIGLAS